MQTNCVVQGETAIGFEDVYCKTLVIPEGVTVIKSGAFRDYYGLEEVVFPSTLQMIGSGAFENCTNLKYVSLPFEMSELGIGVFAGCVNLIFVDLLFTQIRIIPENAFFKCKSLQGVFLSNDIERICKNAFLGCRSLAYFYTPNKLKVFECIPCSKFLDLIWIPDSVIHMEDVEWHTFENTQFVLSQNQYDRFKLVLPRTATINCEEYTNQNIRKLQELTWTNKILDNIIVMLNDSTKHLPIILKVNEEMVLCLQNKPSKIQISKIIFSDVDKIYDITTTVTFKRSREYYYKRTEFEGMQNTFGSGFTKLHQWEMFELYCANHNSLYKSLKSPQSKNDHMWTIEIEYVNGNKIEYASNKFDNEEYLILLDCFGEYLATPPENTEGYSTTNEIW